MRIRLHVFAFPLFYNHILSYLLVACNRNDDGFSIRGPYASQRSAPCAGHLAIAVLCQLNLPVCNTPQQVFVAEDFHRQKVPHQPPMFLRRYSPGNYADHLSHFNSPLLMNIPPYMSTVLFYHFLKGATITF